MHKEFQRVQYIKVEKEDKFFSSIAKKYKGRYYKNLKQGAGWSFPFEYKEQIDQQRMEFMSKGTIVEKSSVAETLEVKAPIAETETVKAPIAETETVKEGSVQAKIKPIVEKTFENKQKIATSIKPKVKAPISYTKVSKPTQTDLENHKYKYDLPDSYKSHFVFYKNLIQRTN